MLRSFSARARAFSDPHDADLRARGSLVIALQPEHRPERWGTFNVQCSAFGDGVAPVIWPSLFLPESAALSRRRREVMQSLHESSGLAQLIPDVLPQL